MKFNLEIFKQVFCPWIMGPEGATESAGFSIPDTDGNSILSARSFSSHGGAFK